MDKLAVIPDEAMLAQLRDIHLPRPISWWPPAPGWYALTLMLIVIIVGFAIFIARHHFRRHSKKQALQALMTIEKEHQRNPNSQRSTAAISELLKQVALLCYPREQVAGLQGEGWLEFLNNTSGSSQHFNAVRKTLLDCPYQPPHRIELTELYRVARQWIEHQPYPARGKYV